MKRRDFLKFAGALGSSTLFTSALANTFFLASAHGAAVPVESLRKILPPNEGQILVPTDAKFKETLVIYNKRVLVAPKVRVMCATPKAVALAIQWARDNEIPLAMRAGGHSYEGFSSSTGLVIDVRPMNKMTMSQNAETVTVGAGGALGQIYAHISAKGRAIPAGSCPTVGVTGHTTGGGFGLLARSYGLACDSLLEAKLVNAKGDLLTLNAQENSDLFWAIRGAGGGSFGIVTELTFKTHKVENVSVFGASWSATPEVATRLMRTWQQWAPNSPKAINTLFKISKGKDGTYNIRCVIQCDGSESLIRQQMELSLFKVAAPASVTYKTLPFIGAVRRFSGEEGPYPSIYMKAKSDYLSKVMTESDCANFLKALPSGVAVMFDSYGGEVGAVANDATAFVHRQDTICSLQYYMEWSDPASTEGKLRTMREFHTAVRPAMSGRAYFNYCDMDLPNWAEAYWGSNLPRLTQIKSQHDPENVFRHAQSVPLKK
ncbi:MAG: FAD-binding oxidoreductase [Bdellovibrionaceae bacterium]|nr:FAD-binding oxidoreductase [Pseudobdellovibrionaceae bacterium]